MNRPQQCALVQEQLCSGDTLLNADHLHLASCPHCQAFNASLITIDDVFLKPETEPRPDAVEAVVLHLRTSLRPAAKKRSPAELWMQRLTTGALLTICVGTFIMRSMVSTWFNDTSMMYDGGRTRGETAVTSRRGAVYAPRNWYDSAPPQPQGGTMAANSQKQEVIQNGIAPSLDSRGAESFGGGKADASRRESPGMALQDGIFSDTITSDKVAKDSAVARVLRDYEQRTLNKQYATASKRQQGNVQGLARAPGKAVSQPLLEGAVAASPATSSDEESDQSAEQEKSVVFDNLLPAPKQQAERKDISVLKKQKSMAPTNGSDPDRGVASRNEPVTENALRRTKIAPQRYLDPNGYWENTYTPGSPLLPQIVQSLRDTLALSFPLEDLMATEQGLLTEHPMDAPVDGALGLATFLDTAALPQPGKVFLQVNIKGAARQTGNRPPLTLAVALPDTRQVGIQDWERIAELLLAVESERRVDDRIYVVTDTGVLDAHDFRYGTLTVFLRNEKNIQKEVTTPAIDAPIRATNAFSRAVTTVLGADPTSLNERVVLTIAHSALSATALEDGPLQQLVQQGGVGSIITLRDSLELKKKAAVGQGSYRLLQPATEPAQLMRDEFLSYGAVVARALRLNVQLSPGVRLIDVIGSRKLSAQESQRDKIIERSIDKRLSASLGIAEDRGDDDPGIQILIPRFLAEDNHAILLELFVPQAGPIADVSLRSKDLVLLKNQTLRASAALPAFGEVSSDTHRAVATNVYAQRLAGTLRIVRELVGNGQLEDALAALLAFSNELREHAPSSGRRETTLDLLSRYQQVLHSSQGALRDARSAHALAASLEVAEEKVRKTHPSRRSP